MFKTCAIYVFCVALICNLYAFGENIKSIEAQFTQETISQDSTILYSGHLYAKTPSKAKWIYNAPTKKEIYINGKNTIVYEPLLEQATYGKSEQKIDFLSILKSAKKRSDGKYYAVFDGIEYQLSLNQDNTPKQITFKDEFENTIVINFKQVKINQFIDDKIFHFVPPKGIDLIQ